MNYIKLQRLALAPHLRQQFDTDRADVSILTTLTVKVIRHVAVEHSPDTFNSCPYFLLIITPRQEARTDYYFHSFLGELLQFVSEDPAEMPLKQPLSKITAH